MVSYQFLEFYNHQNGISEQECCKAFFKMYYKLKSQNLKIDSNLFLN